MPILNFTIRDKVMNHVSGNPYYVCGNSDYVVQLDMDEEWEFAIFTAIIKWKDSDEIEHRAVREFVGDAFVFPRINDAQYAYIGIYAGDKHTTTSGIVACRQSITSGDPPEEPPTPDVYDQIMELVNQALNRNKPPYIGANKHWYEWDADVNDFVDTGIVAEGGGHKGLTRAQAVALVACFKNVRDVFSHVAWKDTTGPIVLPIFANSVDILEELLSDTEDPDIYQDGDKLYINGNVRAEKNNTTLEVTNK